MATAAHPRGVVAHNMVTTAFELDEFTIVKNLGIVRGIVVRSRSILGSIGASLQTIVGGNITILTELCERTRNEAFDLMIQHAAALGANAVIGARYDATEIMQGVTEVLAYGTAVYVEPKPKHRIGVRVTIEADVTLHDLEECASADRRHSRSNAARISRAARNPVAIAPCTVA